MRTVLTRISSTARAGSIAPLLIAVAVASALGLQAAGRTSPAAQLARLDSITGRLDGRNVAVLIEASEPVPYVTAQPDALTVLVDLRNVQSAGVSNRFATLAQDSIASVTVEDAKAPDGAPTTRVKVRLARASTPRVKSERNVIRIDVDRDAFGSTGEDRAAQLPSKANSEDTAK